VHYFTFADGMDHGAKLTAFFRKIEAGEEQKKAFVESFGSFAETQDGLDKYIRQFLFKAYVLPKADQLREKDFPARKLSVAETEAAIGGYRLWEHDTSEARELIEDALQEDPKLAEAHEYKAFLLFHEGKDEEARKEFAAAYELDNNNCLS